MRSTPSSIISLALYPYGGLKYTLTMLPGLILTPKGDLEQPKLWEDYKKRRTPLKNTYGHREICKLHTERPRIGTGDLSLSHCVSYLILSLIIHSNELVIKELNLSTAQPVSQHKAVTLFWWWFDDPKTHANANSVWPICEIWLRMFDKGGWGIQRETHSEAICP